MLGKVKRRIVSKELFGFGLVLLVIWLDELIGLPGILLGGPPARVKVG